MKLDLKEGDLHTGLIGFVAGISSVGTGDAYKFFINNMNISAAGPAASTSPSSQIGRGAATLNGTVNPRAFSTVAWFDWGATTSYGNATPLTSLGQGSADVPMSA